ncbi:hypothetical protein CHUAL_010866 [Chamberlinius hualienensis]
MFVILILKIHGLPITDDRVQLKDNNELNKWITDIDETINKLKECVKFPGLSLAIVKVDSKATDTLIRNYGVLDIDSQRPVDENSRFCIGSLTKGFTAALLTQLLSENKTHHLDSLVKDVLQEEFQLANAALTNNTTIMDILAHRVGVAKHFGAFILGYNLTRAQIIRRVRYLPVVQPFRSSRVFNNFLYVVAGQIIEKLGTGKHKENWWENQLTEKILKPIGMESTVFADRVADWTYNFAIPHASQNENVVPLRAKVTGNILRPLGPAGSICSTASDMSKWIKLLLKGDEYILNSTVVDQLFTISNKFEQSTSSTTKTRTADSPAEGYGLGWTISKYRGNTRVFHSGFSNYYYTMMTLFPDKRFGIYTSVNGPHLIRCDNGIKALHYYLSDLILGTQPWINISNICLYPRIRQSTPKSITDYNKTQMSTLSTTPSTVLIHNRFTSRRTTHHLQRRQTASVNKFQRYEGIYEHPFFGSLLISFNRTVAKLQLNYGYYGKALLEPVNEKIFRMKFFSSVWYQSESDDMKLFAVKNIFNVQFGTFNSSAGTKLVVYLFDTESPPIFTKL